MNLKQLWEEQLEIAGEGYLPIMWGFILMFAWVTILLLG